jgi:hypothetical protein
MMRQIHWIVVLTLILGAWFVAPGTARSESTPHQEFLDALTEIAPFPPAPAKRLCVCRDAQEFTPGPEVGELRPALHASNGAVSYGLSCVLPLFETSDGSVLGGGRCDGLLFDILPKK